MKAALALISILVIFAALLLNWSSASGLLQAAGPINVTSRIGESAHFEWIVLPDKGKSANVTISADGNGSQFLSFPPSLLLPVGKIVTVPINVTIPSNYTGAEKLTPVLRATEAGKDSNQGSIINVEVAKNVTIHVINSSVPTLPNQTINLPSINSSQ
jgi:hypothetical protein